MRAAAVTGLEAEARIARRAGLLAAASGGVAAQTCGLAQRLLDEGADGLISFGIAGALAPTLVSGALVLPHGVIDGTGKRYPVDMAWHDRVVQAMRAAGLKIDDGDILGADEAAASPARKAALFHVTQAVAVDLESHLVAEAAARAGKPFLVLRAIADPATQALPPAAVNGLRADGKPALGRVLLSVARSPRQIPALLHLAGDTRCALAALGSAVRVLPL